MLVTVVAGFAMFAACSGESDRGTDGGGPSSRELFRLIGLVEPWRADGTYSDEAWARTFNVARAFKAADPRLVSAAFAQFTRLNAFAMHSEFEEPSRPLILLVMFDLRDRPGGLRMASMFRNRYPQWVVPPLTWPVGWRDGKPYIMEPWLGSTGRPYDPRAKYEYFRTNFPYRKLPQAIGDVKLSFAQTLTGTATIPHSGLDADCKHGF